jgi:hypothetical protein
VNLCSVCGHGVTCLKMINQEGNASGRVLFLEQLDLSHCRVMIIAGIDYEQRGLPLEFQSGQLFDRGGRGQNAEARSTKDARKAFSK